MINLSIVMLLLLFHIFLQLVLYTTFPAFTIVRRRKDRLIGYFFTKTCIKHCHLPKMELAASNPLLYSSMGFARHVQPEF